MADHLNKFYDKLSQKDLDNTLFYRLIIKHENKYVLKAAKIESDEA